MDSASTHLQARTPYQYQPLAKENEIRLLKVVNTHEGFNYDIIAYALDEAPPYQTVSYAWGPDVQDQAVNILPNQALYVNETLSTALPYLSKQLDCDFLWIDQVCINQEDVLERNSQVKQKGQIYRECKRVLVWLGDTLRSIDAFRDLVQVAEGDSDMVTKSYTEVDVFFFYSDNCYHKLTNKAWSLEKSDQVAILELAALPWFRRAWTFQESVLPPVARFVLRDISVSYPGLFRILSVLYGRPSTVQLSIRRVNSGSFEQGIETVQKRKVSTTLNFSDLLSELSPLKLSSDPRDGIYGFLGLNKDPAIVIEPDYQLSLREVFISTTFSIIRGSRDLEIFETPSRVLDKDIIDDLSLPSWVPDYRRPFTHYRSTVGFSMSNSDPVRYNQNATYSTDTLSVRGKCFYIVGAVSPLADIWNQGSNRAKSLEDAHQILCQRGVFGWVREAQNLCEDGQKL